MSIRVMANVWESSRQSGAHLLALLALADWANDRGECDPSYTQIAARMRVDRRRAVRVLADLERDGEIEKVVGAGFTFAKGAVSNRLVLRRYADPSGAGTTTPSGAGATTLVARGPLPLVAPVPPTTINNNNQQQQGLPPTGGHGANDAPAVAAEMVDPVSEVARTAKANRPTTPAADKVSQAEIRAMVEELAAARGYPVANFARHTRAAKRLIKAGRTPADVTRTVAYIRRECHHMAGQPVTMETVSKYIGLACPIAQSSTGADGQRRELPDWIVDGAAA